jgi:lipopolysaccharide export system protein LptA
VIAIVLAGALLLLPPAEIALAQQQAAPAQPQAAAPGQEGGDGGGGEPIEIVADSLTVAQEQRLATFAGNVDAIQGELRLRADRLLVYYDAAAGEDEQPAATPAGGDAGQGIRRLEASGNVSLASPARRRAATAAPTRWRPGRSRSRATSC